MKTVCIIQARMGSSRFPNKMIKPLGDLKLIEWVILRLKKTRQIADIYLATTINSVDNILVEIALNNNISVYRGNELDVLSRFIHIAKESEADNIVRICADNPFIDSVEIDSLISHFNLGKFDYACNHKDFLNNNYVDGFGAEILTKDTLNKVNYFSNKPCHFEHVTSYIWENQEYFNISAMQPSKELTHPELRFDIDTELDLIKLNNLVTKYNICLNTSADEIVKYKLLELKEV